MSQTWFITGGAKGIGFCLANQLLQKGYNVAVTSRNMEDLQKKYPDKSENLLLIQTDLTSEDSVNQAISNTIKKFNTLDVVVNNAGYAQQGTFETLTHKDFLDNFDINVFAPLRVIRSALPYLRKQCKGHIINISSIVGFNGGYAGWGSYAGTKFSLAGITEALAAEVDEIGIKATVVYPGPVRTNFLSKGHLHVAAKKIDDYKEAQKSLDLHINEMDGAQTGNAEKVAELIIKAALQEKPPVHLFIGKIANYLAEQKIETIRQSIQAWKIDSENTDYDE